MKLVYLASMLVLVFGLFGCKSADAPEPAPETETQEPRKTERAETEPAKKESPQIVWLQVDGMVKIQGIT
ncbi:MAG: hypothetical protein ACYTDT_10140 [Planctomycetota bacterium]|jgi:hypothetical protein